MTRNQLLYVNGEVVKLWLYPRGPDSGYICLLYTSDAADELL